MEGVDELFLIDAMGPILRVLCVKFENRTPISMTPKDVISRRFRVPAPSNLFALDRTFLTADYRQLGLINAIQIKDRMQSYLLATLFLAQSVTATRLSTAFVSTSTLKPTVLLHAKSASKNKNK